MALQGLAIAAISLSILSLAGFLFALVDLAVHPASYTTAPGRLAAILSGAFWYLVVPTMLWLRWSSERRRARLHALVRELADDGELAKLIAPQVDASIRRGLGIPELVERGSDTQGEIWSEDTWGGL